MGKLMTDLFTSQAVFDVTESAANTLTFEKLETGLSVYDKIGWVIQRIEWRVAAAAWSQFNSTADTLDVGITLTNTLTTLDEANPAVLFKRKLLRLDIGTAASGSIFTTTGVDDYSQLAGGGILTLPNPLYMGVVGTGLAAACRVVARVFFKAVELSDQDYFNLAQSRQLLIST